MKKQEMITEIATLITMLEQDPKTIVENYPNLKEEGVYPFLVGYAKASLEYILEN